MKFNGEQHHNFSIGLSIKSIFDPIIKYFHISFDKYIFQCFLENSFSVDIEWVRSLPQMAMFYWKSHCGGGGCSLLFSNFFIFLSFSRIHMINEQNMCHGLCFNFLFYVLCLMSVNIRRYIALNVRCCQFPGGNCLFVSLTHFLSSFNGSARVKCVSLAHYSLKQSHFMCAHTKRNLFQ